MVTFAELTLTLTSPQNETSSVTEPKVAFSGTTTDATKLFINGASNTDRK